MTALYIIGGIILLLMLMLLARVKIGISYCGTLNVEIKYLFLRFTAWSSEEAKEEKPKKKAKKEKKAEAKPEKKEHLPLKELLAAAKEILSRLISKLSAHLFLERARLKVLVADEDPAKTGILYGAACAAAGSIYGLLCSIKHRSGKKRSIDFSVKPDFLADKPELMFDIVVSIRLLFLLSVASTAGLGLMKLKGLTTEEDNKENKDKGSTDERTKTNE